jgi:hypothetical protein
MHRTYWLEKLKKGKDYLADLGIGGSITLNWIFEKSGMMVYWIQMAKDRIQCLVLVTM